MKVYTPLRSGKHEKKFFEIVLVWEKKFRLRYRYRNWTLVSVPNTTLLYIMYMNYECSTLPASVNNIDCRIEKESEADKRFPGFEQFSICTIQTQCKFLLHKIANSPQLFAWERSIVMFDGFSRRRNVRFYNKASFYHFAKNRCKAEFSSKLGKFKLCSCFLSRFEIEKCFIPFWQLVALVFSSKNVFWKILIFTIIRGSVLW